MRVLTAAILFFFLICVSLGAFDKSSDAAAGSPSPRPENWVITGFRDAAHEQDLEEKFLAVPDPKLAEEHLRILTQAPHVAGSPEDKATADYVAEKFRAAGLETSIVQYKVWFNYPVRDPRRHDRSRRRRNARPAPRARRWRSLL